MAAFIEPVISGRLQHGRLIELLLVARIFDDNTILQEAGGADFLDGDLDDGKCALGTVFYELMKALRRGTHADDQRHSLHLLSRCAFDETLHDRGGLSCLVTLHPAVRLVDDEIEPIRLLACCIVECFPDGILAPVSMLAELPRLRELLRIEKINIPI